MFGKAVLASCQKRRTSVLETKGIKETETKGTKRTHENAP